MKKLFLSLMLLLLAFQVQAGGGKYEEAMTKALSMMDTATTMQTYQNCANRFERIGNAEKKEWLPFYYAGLCYSLMVYQEKDPSQIDVILDRADEYLDKAEDMKLKDHEKSEVLVVRGMVCGGRMQVDPQTRGMEYGPKASMLYNRAKNLNPENPRAISMLGQSTMFTPKQFGGGRDKAIPMLEDAIALFDSWKSPEEIFPDWGREITQNMLDFGKSGEKAPWEEEMEKEMEQQGGEEGAGDGE